MALPCTGLPNLPPIAYLVLVDDLPEPAEVGVGRHALEHHLAATRQAGRQWTDSGHGQWTGSGQAVRDEDRTAVQHQRPTRSAMLSQSTAGIAMMGKSLSRVSYGYAPTVSLALL